MQSSIVDIKGAFVRPLRRNADSRGDLHELFRSDWGLSETPKQWNLVRSLSNTLRGMHVHVDHDDYLIVLSGAMYLALHDIRPGSASCGYSALTKLTSNELSAAFVPRGVMHGFCFVEPTDYIYGLTSCWSIADDLGCAWNDPDLGFDWPVTNPVLSERDMNAQSLSALKASLTWKIK